MTSTTPASPSGYDTLPFVTIDGPTSLDLDDALFVEATDPGTRLVVAIANPTKAIQIKSAEDERAYLIGATAYLRDKAVKPMLPRVLSESQCSLLAGSDRQALVLDLSLDANGTVITSSLALSPIRVAQRLAYADIPALTADEAHPLSPMLRRAASLAMTLLARRRRSGALALYDLHRMLVTDEEGSLRLFETVEDTIGYVVIQEAMILSNATISAYAIDHDIPVIYRNHTPRNAAPSSADLAASIERMIATRATDLDAIQTRFTAIAGKALYGASVTGHYGLALPSYLHATSPLRRYADLVTLRQLTAHLRGKPLPYAKADLETIADHLNTALARRQEERSASFAAVTRRQAANAIARGQARSLADHEVQAALKAVRDGAEMPLALVDELVARIEKLTLGNACYSTFVFELDAAARPAPVTSAIDGALTLSPPLSAALWNFGTQAEFLLDARVDFINVHAGFQATATARYRSAAVPITGTGVAPQKRLAEQLAFADLIRAHLGLPTATPAAPVQLSVAAAASSSAAPPNSRGNLSAWCLKHKQPEPVFATTSFGPTHRMVFQSVCTVPIPARPVVGIAKAQHKREAENEAAYAALRQLQGQEPPAMSPVAAPPLPLPSTPAPAKPVGALGDALSAAGIPLPSAPPSEHPATANPSPPPTASPAISPAAASSSVADTLNWVGLLQETAQKRKLPFPVYTFDVVNAPNAGAPPLAFVCTVRVAGQRPLTAQGRATRKQDAKSVAARLACEQWGLLPPA